MDLVSAGRALDAGDPTRARDLLPGGDPRPEARWLLARAASAAGDPDTAVALFESLAGTREDLERHRQELLVRELAAAGRMTDALARSEPLVAGPLALPRQERMALGERRGGWLEGLGRDVEALAEIEAARSLAGHDRDRERLNLRRAACLLRLGRATEARRILEPLADSASTAAAMREATRTLAEIGAPTERPPARRLARARRFAELRAFDDALAELSPLLEGSASPLLAEARFERARILFDRRRHYVEAIAALDAVIAEGSPRAEDARFLRARALSRLDRDEEAIAAYLDAARRSGNKAHAAEARFFAARLLYYLGRHGQALADLEKLVGNGKARGKAGKRLRSGLLGTDQARDAHFVAGMSALLAGSPRPAEEHFLAASEGSGSAEALERNRYWRAVARLEGRREDGPELLREICATDGTSWYALWARSRLAAAGHPSGACQPDRIAVPAAREDRDPPEAVDVPGVLEPLSSLAAFFARAGLYRDAAAELARAEVSAAPKDRRAWIAAYLAVDAPHRAVRSASRGLAWPPRPEDVWKARAAYPEPFPELTFGVEEERGLPRHLIASIARKESLFDPGAVSPVGALGMMQMMPHTYETNRVRAGLPPLAPGGIPGPEASIRAAGHELAWLLERFGGSLPLGVMGYNGGAAAVSRWLERSGGLPMDVFVEKASFGQTRNYVRRVYQNLVRYRLLAGEPLPDLPALAEKGRNTSDDADLPTSDDPVTQADTDGFIQPGEADE
ncbi:MAG TPA: transglycosylase SLT domain-containing protein [Polyangia bacterium]|nr:transglycosylase SLT domain-containing protein [Polyangia bacterium]